MELKGWSGWCQEIQFLGSNLTKNHRGRRPDVGLGVIQMLRNAFGTDFNPTSSIRERILASKSKSMPYTGNAIEERLSSLEESIQALTQMQMALLDKVNLLLDRLPAPSKAAARK